MQKKYELRMQDTLTKKLGHCTFFAFQKTDIQKSQISRKFRKKWFKRADVTIPGNDSGNAKKRFDLHRKYFKLKIRPIDYRPVMFDFDIWKIALSHGAA